MMSAYLNKPEEESMARYTESQKKATIKYAKTNLKRVPFDVKKDYYENVLSAIPEISGMSVNGFVKAAITEKIQRDGLNLPIDQYKP